MRASPPTADAGVRRALRSLGRSDGVAQSDGRRRADGVSGLRLGSLVFSVWLVKAVAGDGPAASVDNQPRDWLRRFEGYPSGHRPSPGIMPRLGRTPHTFQPPHVACRRQGNSLQGMVRSISVRVRPIWSASACSYLLKQPAPRGERLQPQWAATLPITASAPFADAFHRFIHLRTRRIFRSYHIVSLHRGAWRDSAINATSRRSAGGVACCARRDRTRRRACRARSRRVSRPC
jgi:hypothetical protein